MSFVGGVSRVKAAKESGLRGRHQATPSSIDQCARPAFYGEEGGDPSQVEIHCGRGATDDQAGTDHRHHRSGRLLPGRAAAAKGYEVHGIIRRSSSFQHGRIDHLYHDPHETRRAAYAALRRPRPTRSGLVELHQRRSSPTRSTTSRAQSHVAVSFEMPEYTADADGDGHAAAARGHPARRLADPLLPGWQLRDVREGASRPPQTRDDAVLSAQPVRRRQGLRPLDDRQLPRGYGIFACNGILFNHESPAARRNVRHAQGDARRRAHPGRRSSSTSTWATSTPGATGAMRRSTSRRCG